MLNQPTNISQIGQFETKITQPVRYLAVIKNIAFNVAWIKEIVFPAVAGL